MSDLSSCSPFSLNTFNSISVRLLRTAYTNKKCHSVSVSIKVAEEQNIGKCMSMLGLTLVLQ